MASTLGIDVGGTSLKLARLSGDGTGLEQRANRRTPPGLSPTDLVEHLVELAERLRPFDQIGVGFPGPVSAGRVLDGANLTLRAGPGSDVDATLAAQWRDFDLAGAIRRRLAAPVVVCNDADVAALACAAGNGRELTVTLGTGVGTGLVIGGRLAPHVEHSDTPLLGANSLDELVGEGTRKVIDAELWQERVRKVLEYLDEEVAFDRCYVAGGNARRVWRDGLGDLRSRIWVTSEPVGLLGWARLFSD